MPDSASIHAILSPSGAAWVWNWGLPQVKGPIEMIPPTRQLPSATCASTGPPPSPMHDTDWLALVR